MEKHNVKIVRDPRKSLKSIKFNNFKNLSVTWFEENAWKWNFITLLLLITPESKLEHGGVGSFLKCIYVHKAYILYSFIIARCCIMQYWGIECVKLIFLKYFNTCLSVKFVTGGYTAGRTWLTGCGDSASQSPHSDYVTRCYFNLCPSKVHVAIEYHVMCLVFCMYSTLYSVQYGEILLS